MNDFSNAEIITCQNYEVNRGIYLHDLFSEHYNGQWVVITVVQQLTENILPFLRKLFRVGVNKFIVELLSIPVAYKIHYLLCVERNRVINTLSWK